MNAAIIIIFIVVIATSVQEIPIPPDAPERDCSSVGYTPFSVHRYICGSDGITYINELHLEYTNCLNGQNVTVVKEGYCDEEEGRRAQEAHRRFMAEYAKQIIKAIKEGRPIPYLADAPMPNLDDYPEEEEEGTETAVEEETPNH